MNPSDRKYTKEHEWIRPDGDSDNLIGITDYAQEHLGDVVYLDLPKAGANIVQFDKMGEVESVKAVSDLFSPISGEVVEINQDAVDHPELVNEDPYGRGWLLRVRASDPGEFDKLLSVDQYDALLKDTGG